MEFIEFESLSHGEKIQYSFLRHRMSYSNTHDVAEQMKMQAKGLLSVPLTKHYVGDYLISLAQAIVSNEEVAKATRYFLTIGPSEEDIAFAASVQYKEAKPGKWSKPKYYSTQFKKVSSVATKQWDKRWQQIYDFHNGTFESVMRLVEPQYTEEKFHRYVMAYRVREWFTAEKKRWRKMGDAPYNAASYVGWSSEHDEQMAIDYGYKACLKALQIHGIKSELRQLTDAYNQYAMVKKLEE